MAEPEQVTLTSEYLHMTRYAVDEIVQTNLASAHMCKIHAKAHYAAGNIAAGKKQLERNIYYHGQAKRWSRLSDYLADD